MAVDAAGAAPFFATVGFLAIIGYLSGGVLLSSPSGAFLRRQFLILLAAVFIARRVMHICTVNLCFDSRQIVQIRGHVVYDSSFTSSGMHLMRIMLSGCSDVFGNSGNASGLVAALGRERAIISSGTRIILRGRFSDGLFIYDGLQVQGRNILNEIRERLIPILERRLSPDGGSSLELSSMLLFGRTDSGSPLIRELAASCGCSHILALSGMHLGILASMCKRAFGNGRVGTAFSYLAVIAFLFTAGPRPSLVRAALSFFLGFMAVERRTVMVFILQMLLFPQSMADMGCCYSYMAIFAIVYLSPYLEALFYQIIGRPARLFGATVSVLVFSVPVLMLTDGCWHPSVLIVSPLAALLAAASMLLGLLILSFGQVGFLMAVNGRVYEAMERLFIFGGNIPSLGWTGYAVLLSMLLLLGALIAVFRKRAAGERHINCSKPFRDAPISYINS